ncbi:Uncharacterised protein [Bordetella pertussis]|nr:Uncharacterised protein [Bordetella pertussis]
MVSPLVWPRPTCSSLTSRLPRSTVISPLNVMVGHTRPGGIDSTLRNRRGKRPISLALSCSPRSAIRS